MKTRMYGDVCALMVGLSLLTACLGGDHALSMDTASDAAVATATMSQTGTTASVGQTATRISTGTGGSAGGATTVSNPPPGATSVGWTTSSTPTTATGSAWQTAIGVTNPSTGWATSTIGPGVYTSTSWLTRIQTGVQTATASIPSTGRASVTFSNGQAMGAISGWGWVRLGAQDSLSSPTCGGMPITAARPCLTETTWSSPTSLCMSGFIPALPAAPVQSDYDANWGLEVGVNATADEPSGSIGSLFDSMVLSFTGTPSRGLRAVVHLMTDPLSTTYCFDSIKSGQTLAMTKFNTACWDNSGKSLTLAETAQIDRISLMVPSGSSAISVGGLCLDGIVLSSGDVSRTTATAWRTTTVTTTGVRTQTTASTATDLVTFTKGQAQGLMTGWGWVNWGEVDSLTSPTLGGQPVTRDRLGQGALDWSTDDGLCISGSIPALPASPVQFDYDDNWGFQVGVNATADEPSGTIGRSFSAIALSFSGWPTSGLRAVVHRQGDPAGIIYCYDRIRSNQMVDVAKFNTACWDSTGKSLSVADAARIDKIGLQVSSGSSAVTVSNLCLTAIRLR